MDFRSELLATLGAIRPVLEEPGVLVVGSEIPNLLERDAASTLVVSRDVDIGVPVRGHARVKARLPEIRGLRASEHEPSVWVPERPGLIEVNFVGLDPDIAHPSQSYVLEDDVLPLMVFGQLSWLRAGPPAEVEGLTVPLPRKAGLILEKLATDRTGLKGDRDLSVVAALLPLCEEADMVELATHFTGLPADLRYAARSNLALLSLINRVDGMPDPALQRGRVAALLRRLDDLEEAPP